MDWHLCGRPVCSGGPWWRVRLNWTALVLFAAGSVAVFLLSFLLTLPSWLHWTVLILGGLGIAASVGLTVLLYQLSRAFGR